jgi:hypothetical protein
VTKPLLKKGIIYIVSGRKYPNKLLYINKIFENIEKIRDYISYYGWKNIKKEAREYELGREHLYCWLIAVLCG